MVKIDIEAFKKAWYKYEQIQQIIKSEENFEKTWICYSFDEVKKMARSSKIKSMLSNEAIIDLQKDCSFEEIQRINASLIKIKEWNTYSKQEVRSLIDNEIFSKYSINA